MSDAIDALFEPNVSPRQLERGAEALHRLACWWLHDDALARLRADEETAHLSGGDRALRPHEFLVLLVSKRPSRVLAPAFGIPLLWQRSNEATRIAPLPEALDSMAKAAKQRLMQSSPRKRDDIDRLDLRLGEGCPDISRLRLTFESAGAAIEAALRCAVENRAPCHLHAVSAEVGPFGLEAVEGIAEKRRAAARHGVSTLLVAPNQAIEKAAPAADSPTTAVVHLRQAALDAQIAAMAGHFDAPPFGALIDECFRWYGRQPTDATELKIRFFAREIAPAVVEHLRATTPRKASGPPSQDDGPAQPGVDTLVMTAGGPSHEIAILAVLLHGPRKVVVLERRSAGAAKSEESAVIRSMRKHLGDVIEFVDMPWHRPADPDAPMAGQLDRVVEGARCVGIDFSGGPKDDAIELLDWHRSRDASLRGPATYIGIARRPPKGVSDYSVTDYARGRDPAGIARRRNLAEDGSTRDVHHSFE